MKFFILVFGLALAPESRAARLTCESVENNSSVFLSETWYLSADAVPSGRLRQVQLVARPSGMGSAVSEAVKDENFLARNSRYQGYARYAIGRDNRCYYYLMIPEKFPAADRSAVGYLRGMCNEFLVFLVTLACRAE
jgi:hypothetical protein